jgi:hypothetical protein
LPLREVFQFLDDPRLINNPLDNVLGSEYVTCKHPKLEDHGEKALELLALV